MAPVIAHVPESRRPAGRACSSRVDQPAGRVYAGLLDATARSFAVRGFKAIVFLGDSGGNPGGPRPDVAKLDR